MALKVQDGCENGKRVFWGPDLSNSISDCSDVECYIAAQELEKEGAIRFIDADGTSSQGYMVTPSNEFQAWTSNSKRLNFLAQEILEHLYKSWERTGSETLQFSALQNFFDDSETHRLLRAKKHLESKGLIITDVSKESIELTPSGISRLEDPERDNLEIHMGDNYNLSNINHSNFAVNSPGAKQSIEADNLSHDKIRAGLENLLSGLQGVGLPSDIEIKVNKALKAAEESLDDSDPEYALQSVDRVLRLTSNLDKERQQILELLGPITALLRDKPE